MTRCPFCELDAPRAEVHAHMVAEHGDRAEAWRDARSGRMRHRIQCPLCGDAYERSVKPRLHGAGGSFLEEFAREIRMVGFDQLLNHLQAEHAEAPDRPGGSPAPDPLPAAGPGGGRGRPGVAGVPLPPGMGESDVAPGAGARLIEAHRRARGSE